MRKLSLSVVAVVALVLSACGSPSTTQEKVQNPTLAPTAAAPARTTAINRPLAPMDTAHSTKMNADITIMSVDDEQFDEGSGVVFSFQIHNVGDTMIPDYAWGDPTMVYGPAGTPAQSVVSSGTGVGLGQQGPIPPGATQTIKVGYQGVAKSQLINVVLSEASVTWQGDFTNFKR